MGRTSFLIVWIPSSFQVYIPNWIFWKIFIPIVHWTAPQSPALVSPQPTWLIPPLGDVRPLYLPYGRKSADRTKPHFDVIFFVFLSTYFGNLEVCCAKTFNIFWKYMSARLSTYLCFDQSFIGGLFNYPYILPFLKKLLHFKTLSAAYFRHFLFFLVIW